MNQTKTSEGKNFPNGYTPLPVKKYVRPFSIGKQTKYRKWFEKHVEALIPVHSDIDKFRTYRFHYFLKWVIFILLFCVGLWMISFSGIKSDSNGGYYIPDEGAHKTKILIILGGIFCVIALATWALFGIYSCIFFQYSKTRFQKTKRYDIMVYQYNSAKKLKGVKWEKIRLLRKMDIISKEVYNLIKYRRHSNISADGNE